MQAALIAYAVLSVVTFVTYGWDKRRARVGGRRVPERTLHLLALLGGVAGAWLGMRVFHHKTKKIVFVLVMALAALLHAGGWGWWLLGRSEAE